MADQADLGAMDPAVMKLAIMNAIEVDSAKTKQHVSLEKDQRPKSYPDFMQKRNRTYESKKILRRLYRECKDLGGDMFSNKVFMSRQIDQHLVYSGKNSRFVINNLDRT